MSSDALRPSAALVCKLSSIVVHADELRNPGGHSVDRIALDSLLDDAEVKAWVVEMVALGLAPVKRSASNKEGG